MQVETMMDEDVVLMALQKADELNIDGLIKAGIVDFQPLNEDVDADPDDEAWDYYLTDLGREAMRQVLDRMAADREAFMERLRSFLAA